MAEGCRVPLKAGKHTQRHTHTHIQNDSIANIAKALKFITWERKKKWAFQQSRLLSFVISTHLWKGYHRNGKLTEKDYTLRNVFYPEKIFIFRENVDTLWTSIAMFKENITFKFLLQETWNND